MDINTMRIFATVASFVVFIGILAWSYARRHKASFDTAANIPLNDE